MVPCPRSDEEVHLLVRATILVTLATPGRAGALPTGYLVYTHGDANDAESRAIFRMTLPGTTEVIQLTASEAVECKISPDGRWVAYAKAKLPGGTDYHDLNFWRLYVVSIHGTGDGREENLIDDNGYWPSWGADGKLFYSQVHGHHTRIMRATLDAYGRRVSSDVFFETGPAFGSEVPELNECYVSPRGDWFAARVRQVTEPGVATFTVAPHGLQRLATAGSKGCMPVISPDGTWALIAGAEYGVRWGESPLAPGRQTNQVLIEPRTGNGRVYHPGFASDGNWVMAAHSEALDHNEGPYDVYIYQVDGNRNATNEQPLLQGGFNGWPDIWVGEPSDPPPPVPWIDAFYPDAYTITSGADVVLTWETSFADGAILESAPVAVDGTSTVTPGATTTYTLTAENSLNAGVQATGQCTVTVHATPRAVAIDELALARDCPHDQPDCAQDHITAGEIATLSWRVTNPTALDINGDRAAPVGSTIVEPLQTTTYTLTAHGHQGPVFAEVTLTVGALEAIESPLLEDRGGCMCGAGAGASILLLALGLAGGWLGRRV